MKPTTRSLLLALVPALVMLASPSWAADGPKSRTFRLSYEATVRDLPEGAHGLELWLPLPQSDANQTIRRVEVDAPSPLTIGREPARGNQALRVRVEAPRDAVRVTLTIEATRRENVGRDEAPTAEERAVDLASEPLVPLDGPIKALADEATRGLTTDAEKARAIYDKVTGMMVYDKSGTGWGRGDALFACDARRGNCTDFHALLIGMTRSAGIPARFAIGFPLPEGRGSGEIPGYHCWAEVYVEGRGWVPVDSSEASKDPSRRDYYFGHHDENRIEFSRGRHLVLDPPQHGPPLNFFVYPYAEVDGRPHPSVDRRISFHDLADAESGR